MTEYEYQTEVVSKRKAYEEEEKKHDCSNCRERIGVPCLKAYRCERTHENRSD